jgi:hypothetical protein
MKKKDEKRRMILIKWIREFTTIYTSAKSSC